MDSEEDDNSEEDDADDDEGEYENPFKKKSADEQDRDRLNSGSESANEDDRKLGVDSDQEEIAGMSCDDFRGAIRQQTIDQVSLDISDPYRPDEIDLARYQKLKQKFDEKQTMRTWRNVGGRSLGDGATS